MAQGGVPKVSECPRMPQTDLRGASAVKFSMNERAAARGRAGPRGAAFPGSQPVIEPCCVTLLRIKVAIQGSVAQVGSGNLVGVTDAREQLSAATKRYRRTEAAHETAREAVIMAVVAALRGGLSPTDVERLSPFSGAYIRKLAREHAIPPAPPGPKRAVS